MARLCQACPGQGWASLLLRAVKNAITESLLQQVLKACENLEYIMKKILVSVISLISMLTLLSGCHEEKCHQKVGVNFDIGHARSNVPYSQKYQISTWLSMLGKHIVGYHLHQVKDIVGGFENHTAFEDIYGKLISLASFFRCWAQEEISHAPVVFEMRTENAYPITLETFSKYKA